jgi:hypothetical protein
MGYNAFNSPSIRTADIKFDESHPFAGAELTLRLTAPVDFVLKMVGLQELSRAEMLKALASTADLIGEFGDLVLVSWNCDGRDGAPAAANGAGLLGQPIELVAAVMEAWTEVMTGTSAPLADSLSASGISGSGATRRGTRSLNPTRSSRRK